MRGNDPMANVDFGSGILLLIIKSTWKTCKAILKSKLR